MRILHIAAGLPSGGGISESVPALCRHLRQRGHEVTLATLDGPLSEAALAADAAGVRLVRFAPSFPRALYFSWQMLRGLPVLVREADVVHVHSNWTFPVWWGCRCALQARKPLVMSPRGCLDPVRLLHSAWKKRLVSWMDRSFLRRASVIHATAECEKKWIRAYLSRQEAKTQRTVDVTVIPNGIELDSREKRNTRNQEKGAARTLLYLGRLHPLKGLDLLIEAWSLVQKTSSVKGPEVGDQRAEIGFDTTRELMNSRTDEVPRWRLVIAGPDEQGTLKGLKEQVKRVGVEPSVSFAGPLYGEEKTRALQSADLFVLPTRSENFGIAVAEALAAGVPVITTKGAPWSQLQGMTEVGSLRTASGRVTPTVYSLQPTAFSSNGRCGWWVDVGAEPLAEALREAMSLTDEERRAMGENGRHLVERKYRWETVAERMAELYKKFVNARMR